MIEDGVVNSFITLIPMIAKRKNSDEYVLHMLRCLTSLSESSTGCRMDMLQRGVVDLLQALLPYCNEDDSRYFIIKVTHNLLEIVKAMSMKHFEESVSLVVEALQTVDDDMSIVIYACSCLLIFAKEKFRNLEYLFDIALDCMPDLLKSKDSLIQFYGVTISGFIFEFNNW